MPLPQIQMSHSQNDNFGIISLWKLQMRSSFLNVDEYRLCDDFCHFSNFW